MAGDEEEEEREGEATAAVVGEEQQEDEAARIGEDAVGSDSGDIGDDGWGGERDDCGEAGSEIDEAEDSGGDAVRLAMLPSEQGRVSTETVDMTSAGDGRRKQGSRRRHRERGWRVMSGAVTAAVRERWVWW